MAIKDLINAGIGYSPGSLGFVVTRGLTLLAITPATLGLVATSDASLSGVSGSDFSVGAVGSSDELV